MLNRSYLLALHILVGGTALFLWAIYLIVGPGIAIRGSYILLGLLIATAIFQRAVEVDDTETNLKTASLRGRGGKAIAVIICISIAYLFIFRSRALVLILALPVGYGIVGVQYVQGRNGKIIISQVAALFALAGVSKFLTTGFYFGSGDLLLRAAEIRGLLSGGHTSSIPLRYEYFPGLHILVGSLSALSGLGVEDSILMTGITSYTAVLVIGYAMAAVITGSEKLSIAVAIVLSFARPIHKFSTYFFPQSLAIVLIIYFLYFTFKRTTRGTRNRATEIGMGILLLATVVTHHLSLLFVLPMVGLFLLVSEFNGCDIIDIKRVGSSFLILGTVAVGYWTYVGRAWRFYVQLIGAFQMFLKPELVINFRTKSSPVIYAFGQRIPKTTVRSIVIYPPYVYLGLLLALFVLGLIFIHRNKEFYVKFASILVAGVVASVFLFETPLSLKALKRIRLAWTLPFAFIIGAAIVHLRSSFDYRVARVILVTLFVLTSLGPMAAADDLGSFSKNPHKQVDFGEKEYKQLEESARFYDYHGSRVTAFHRTHTAFRHFVDFQISTVESPRINDSGIWVEEGLFIYRRNIVSHKIKFVDESRNTAGTMYISEVYLDRSIAVENKVFSAGEVEITWSEDRHRFGNINSTMRNQR